ncbi:MAG TPA: hypothetical protein VH309_02010 [Elusimicrobiota bacterium]|nr:hypothetical protein [Elusimicrobiota bacterium]
MSKARAPLAAALVLVLAGIPARAQSNPSLAPDITGMSQWLSDQFAQGLAFNAGESLDPPAEMEAYQFQVEPSFGVGLIPFDKRQFPQMQVPELQNGIGAALFPSSTLFPNFSLDLRMGLPERGDAYLRFADATIPAGYKISPTMTAQVQTNSIGAGVRRHFFGGDEPMLTVGALYNHIQGYTKLKGTFGVSADGFTADDGFNGNIDWSINSFGLTAIVSQTFGDWTPFAGLGYNYTTGSTHVDLNLISNTFLAQSVTGQGSDRPEVSEGREIIGASYDRPNWSAFANAELKALGELEYRSWIIQAGVALPFRFGRRRASARPKPIMDEDSDTPAAEPATRPRAFPAPDEKAQPDMIFLR